MRIQDSRSLFFSKLNASSDSFETQRIKVQHYDEFALRTFLNGLPYNLQLIARLKNPTNLERAMALVKEEENFIYFRNAMISNYKPQINKEIFFIDQMYHIIQIISKDHNFKIQEVFLIFPILTITLRDLNFNNKAILVIFLKIITFLIFLIMAISINQDQLCLTIKVINQTFRDPRILVNSDLFSIITKCLVNNLGEVI